MPPNLDMSAIQEALARRRAGGVGGGSSLPAAAQTTGGGLSPLGGPETPQPGNPQGRTPNLGQLPQQVQQGAGGAPQSQALQAGQKAQSPSFDPETRELAKSLVQRLLKGL